MSESTEKLFVGSYAYLNNGEEYSEENFSVYYYEKKKQYHYESVVSARTDSGESLKIQVDYTLNHLLAPLEVEIRRSLGSKQVSEHFIVDSVRQKVFYAFINEEKQEKIERSFSSHHFIAAPCFCTAGLYSLNRRLNSMGRTPINMITTGAGWSMAPLEDKTLYVEIKLHGSDDVALGDQTLPAVHHTIYENDALRGINEVPTHLYLSKHMAIPYKIEDPKGIVAQIKNLRKVTQSVNKIF